MHQHMNQVAVRQQLLASEILCVGGLITAGIRQVPDLTL